ncbi:MAG TPA: heterodisulfide reductase-related iron-sulfur binding cluster [Methanocorpusculum sp.]|nr:heterodisulfide reductase-related iron-sulfur binding cluster [Methanocorpusculum sp.]
MSLNLMEERCNSWIFVSCRFNLHTIQPALDTMAVLKQNGIRVIILKAQVCGGSLLIRTDFTGFIPKLQKRNIKAFLEIDTVLTICVLGAPKKNDYKISFCVGTIAVAC